MNVAEVGGRPGGGVVRHADFLALVEEEGPTERGEEHG